MKANKLLCLAAALVISCCAATGCQNSSSSDKDGSSSSASSSSAAESSSSSESSGSESTADSSANDSSTADSSSKKEKKANAIGYDVKNSKRLYDELREKYDGKGYDLRMKSNTNMGSELRICIKDGKVYSSDKNPYTNTTMIYKGGKTMDMFDHTAKTYTEQSVSDGAKLAKQSDLLFAMTGDFIEAKIDEDNDVINEYYKIKADVAGKEGTICFCFRGHNGSFCQITIQYSGDNMPMLFGITELKACEDKVFDSEDVFNYKKVD